MGCSPQSGLKIQSSLRSALAMQCRLPAPRVFPLTTGRRQSGHPSPPLNLKHKSTAQVTLFFPEFFRRHFPHLCRRRELCFYSQPHLMRVTLQQTLPGRIVALGESYRLSFRFSNRSGFSWCWIPIPTGCPVRIRAAFSRVPEGAGYGHSTHSRILNC